MKIKLSKESVGLLYYILCEPMRLPLTRAGMTQGASGMPREFVSPDVKHSKKVAALRKWVREVVCDPEKDIKGKTVEITFREHDGFLSESYCEVMRDLLKFYQPMGGLVENSTVYVELCDVFDGRPHKLDSLESMTMPDDDEPSKVTSIDEGKKEKSKEA